MDDVRSDLRCSAALLREAFGASRFEDERYLAWLYLENPNGVALQQNVDEGGVRVGHMAGVPQLYQRRGDELPIVFPLHIAVAAAARGRGLMTRMSLACLEQAQARRGVVAFVGMPNRSSTPGYTGRLGFRLVGPLPVRLCLPAVPTRGEVESIAVNAAYLESRDFEVLARTIDYAPGWRWSQRWSPELLRWRLSAPGARYALHVSPDAVAVSCPTRALGVPMAVVLKLLPREGVRSAPTGALVSAICGHHGTPAAVYAGFNERLRVRGIPVPGFLRPAPLNLIFHSLDPARVAQDSFQFGTYEFLDFDAY